MKDEQERDLITCGDIHGSFKEITWTITQQYKITDANVIFLGDCGFGFNKISYYNQLFRNLEKRLEKNNITYYFLRGNHDSKEVWDKELIDSFSRFKFLKDHEIIELSGKIIYPIGGATSIDDVWRKNFNNKMQKYGSSRRSWWEDEDIVKKYKDLPNKVDIIVSHTAPLCFDPVIFRLEDETEETYLRDLENRKYLDYIFRNVRCNYWNFGHFHQSLTGSIENTIYKCLSINELYMFR